MKQNRVIWVVAALVGVCGFIFLNNEIVRAQDTGSLDANTFFCTTRYSKKMDDKEKSRRDACQKAYEGEEGCEGDPSDDEDGILEACTAGANAEKPLPPEPEDIEDNPPPEPEPPEIDSRSISGLPRCGNVDTAYIVCPVNNSGGLESTPIWGLLNVILNIAVAMVGVVAVGGLVYAGAMYSSAGSDQEQVVKARTLMKNIAIGLVIFAGMYILLQFVTPGGIF